MVRETLNVTTGESSRAHLYFPMLGSSHLELPWITLSVEWHVCRADLCVWFWRIVDRPTTTLALLLDLLANDTETIHPGTLCSV